MSDQPQSEQSIFLQAIEKQAGPQRAAFLDVACGDNEQLRAAVEALLRAHEKSGDLLDVSDGMARTLDQPPITEGPGTVIGPYKLLEQIGEGGMGVVYMAEQQQPVRRRVALKIIKPGMDTKQVVARFEAERQALALMEHQNIAKVLDAGATEESSRHTPCAVAVDGTRSEPTTFGRPYFVMELVKGIPITEYSDRNSLTVRERLGLFVAVCRAIQHAHQKGVIHRDVKPSNVLVCLYDGQPVPKVIDFGVAKAIQQRLTERTMFTQFGQIVGTLEYMSPEQAEFNQMDIDTRSDVYSLGALLYELLTGSTPISKEQLRAAGFEEMLRLIRQQEPEKPSTRLSHSGDALPGISAQRKTEPKKLPLLVRGELDWIVMRALEKDRTRRYDSAGALASDLERHLNDEPVEACPPSAGYRVRKFARKHRAALGTAAAFVLMLLLAALVSAWQAIRATQAESLAQNRLVAEREALGKAEVARQAEREARRQAEIQRDQTRAAEEQTRMAADQTKRPMSWPLPPSSNRKTPWPAACLSRPARCASPAYPAAAGKCWNCSSKPKNCAGASAPTCLSRAIRPPRSPNRSPSNGNSGARRSQPCCCPTAACPSSGMGTSTQSARMESSPPSWILTFSAIPPAWRFWTCRLPERSCAGRTRKPCAPQACWRWRWARTGIAWLQYRRISSISRFGSCRS